jgi:hypothetical protein
MASHVIEKFTVERDSDGETRPVVCKEGRVTTTGLGDTSNQSVRSGLQEFEFEDNREPAYQQNDGTFQDRYGDVYHRIT